MPWRRGLTFRTLAALVFFSTALLADDHLLWTEYGLVHSGTFQQGKLTITTYEMKDPTGALAAWEWQRSPNGRTCDLAPACNQDDSRTVVSDYNYLLVFGGASPTKAQVTAIIKALPNKHDSSLPAILTFLPQEGMVANSARYILGPVSLAAFAPELLSSKPGFENGAEAQLADYRVGKDEKRLRLVLFYYATPEMARIHTANFRRLPGLNVKRSDVLVALTLPPATREESDTLLSRVQYEAKITWNDTPPPSPIKPLYQLLLNIIYLSLVLAAICLAAGLFYAAMRIYRRRYGTLEADEAMTTLHLTD
jgi:Family of unknown function (DUF6599)